MKVGEVMLKKIILIAGLFLITGCTSVGINTLSIDSAISNVLNQDNELYNTYEVGYRFYKPRNFNLLKSDENNYEYINNGKKYYLYVDILAYYNKVNNQYSLDKDAYYTQEFNYDGKYGFINIIEKDDYFYLKIMYNYAIIEVKVKEDEIIESVIYSSILLSSINYNDNVIAHLVQNNLIGTNEKNFELEGPKEKEETYLDYLEDYDDYDKENEIPDPDVIN